MLDRTRVRVELIIAILVERQSSPDYSVESIAPQKIESQWDQPYLLNR